MVAAAHRLMFRRIQELTPAGRTNEEVGTLLRPDAEHVYGLPAPGPRRFPRRPGRDGGPLRLRPLRRRPARAARMGGGVPGQT